MGPTVAGSGDRLHNLHNFTPLSAPMARLKRPQPAGLWMDGYTNRPSLEATCQALEDRLNEGRPRPWADAIRAPLWEQEWHD